MELGFQLLLYYGITITAVRSEMDGHEQLDQVGRARNGPYLIIFFFFFILLHHC